MSFDITLLGTGSPLPAPDRAGPATLVSTSGGSAPEHLLVDAGRGVMMRLAAAAVGAGDLRAVLLTHLHSDHVTDIGDVITTRWVTTFQPTPLTIVGPPGTATMIDHVLASLGPDIGYRLAHHDDLQQGPDVRVVEVTDGVVDLPDAPGVVTVSCAPTDHRPVEPTVAFRFDHDGAAVVAAGDTVPCEGLDRLSSGADCLVHTTIRKDIISQLPMQRIRDTLDYHSSPEEAAQTAARAGVHTLVLTHYVPPIPPGGDDEWRALAASHFDGRIELGPDLHRIHIDPRTGAPT